MFKGIVIFGEPATGKSTVAQKIATKIPNCKIIEVSTSLIFPISRYFKKLPSSPGILLSELKKILGKKLNSRTTISREKAREIFFSLGKQYSSASFIAEALDKLYSKQYRNTLLIFSGVRGYENAKYFKKKSYLVVFLKANKKDILRRLARERKYSIKEALKELEEENHLYSTPKIDKVANLVYNTSITSVEKIAEEIKNVIQNANTRV